MSAKLVFAVLATSAAYSLSSVRNSARRHRARTREAAVVSTPPSELGVTGAAAANNVAAINSAQTPNAPAPDAAAVSEQRTTEPDWLACAARVALLCLIRRRTTNARCDGVQILRSRTPDAMSEFKTLRGRMSKQTPRYCPAA